MNMGSYLNSKLWKKTLAQRGKDRLRDNSFLFVNKIPDLVRIYDSDGTLVGRASICHLESFEKCGTVTVGGFKTNSISGIIGVLKGRPITAKRDSGFPDISNDLLVPWIAEHQKRLRENQYDNFFLFNFAQIARRLGFTFFELPIAVCSSGLVSSMQIANRFKDLSLVYIIPMETHALFNINYTLTDNILITNKNRHHRHVDATTPPSPPHTFG